MGNRARAGLSLAQPQLPTPWLPLLSPRPLQGLLHPSGAVHALIW